MPGVSDEAHQLQALLDLMFEPLSVIKIAATEATVSFTDDRDNVTTFNVDGKAEKVDLLIALVPCKTTWEAGVLSQEFSAGDTKLVVTYAVTNTGTQLVATFKMTSSDSKQQPRPPVRNVYDRSASIH